MEELAGTKAGDFVEMNRRALMARPWCQSGYRYRPISIHDPATAQFWSQYPYTGWANVKIDQIDVVMLMANDDGVALIYNAFGPDSYEAASVALWEKIAPSCKQIADIGAFTGLYTLIAQKAAPQAQVLTVEPNSASRARLYTNLVWNGCDRSRVSPLAVSGEIGTLPLFVPMGADVLDTGSSLNSTSNVSRTEVVACAPIDAILAQYYLTAPDLMKIDVEGLEVMALQGMPLSFQSRPTLLLEVSNKDLMKQCWDILARHDYKVYCVDDEKLTISPPLDPNNLDGWFDLYAANRGSMNFLCSAREDHVALARQGASRVHALL